MSSTTPNLALTLYDSSTDQVVTFATFRAVWGGPATTSNFYKIDTAWGLLDGRIDILEAYRGSIPVSGSFISANYYEATESAITAYTSGMTIILSVDTTSDGTVTLNINALGTKSVMKVNSSGTAINLTGSDLVIGRRYLFMYDGTRWVWVSANSADQIQIVGTAGNVVTVGSSNNLDGTLTQSLLLSQTINAATAKTSPIDADKIGIVDTAASNVLKSSTVGNLKTVLLNAVYPVGSVVTLGVSTNPATLFGIGTWTAIAGRVIVGIDGSQTEFDVLNETGGAKTVTLTEAQMPAHVHPRGTRHWGGVASGTAGRISGADVGSTGATNDTDSGNTASTGGGDPHSNLQPYIVKYVWERTA